jgi:hypothetical protein
MAEITEQYLRGYLLKFGEEDIPVGLFDNLLRTMRKYGDNRWWESNNPVVLAYHQAKERILLISLDQYVEGASKICGRPVFTHDLFGQDPDFLLEIEQGMKRLNPGWKVSSEGRAALELASENRLERVVQSIGKSVIKFDSAI